MTAAERALIKPWRDDAFEKAAKIVERYFPGEADACAADIRSLISTNTPTLAGSELSERPNDR